MAPRIPIDVPLPKDWSDSLRLGFLSTVSLAHRAVTVVNSWRSNSRIPSVRSAADFERLESEVALLREELRIKDARMARIPAASRPLYPPTERLAILALKAARAWNNAEAARAFLLSPPTIASWLRRLDTDGPEGLVRLPLPINRFPDFVALVVQQLKSLCPSMGKLRIAQCLARLGLQLSTSTVRRMLDRKLAPSPSPKPAPDITTPRRGANQTTSPSPNSHSKKPTRVVTAKHPHHVWHVDLTVVPSALGFWIPWFPGALGQVWPFCHIVAVVLDHFSRRAVLTAAFRRQPTATEVTRFLDTAIAVAGKTPKYIISDQGCQFREDYRDWCDARGIQPRFGAIGQHGSIAVIERFILSLKTEGIRRLIAVPLSPRVFETELLLFLRYYNEHRPHQALGGRTPDEFCQSEPSAPPRPQLETRARGPDGATHKGTTSRRASSLRLVVTHLEGRRHLPIVSLDLAA